jgi:CheY-like chemotaxis protein
MAVGGTQKILAVVGDLFFTVKIHEAAKRAGVAVEFVKSEVDALQKAAEERPVLIIFDLNFGGVDSLKVIREIKAKPETKGISLLGYLSHIQGELKQEAQKAGCDVVLATSAFSQNLMQILTRHAALR